MQAEDGAVGFGGGGGGGRGEGGRDEVVQRAAGVVGEFGEEGPRFGLGEGAHGRGRVGEGREG